jgi:hypothetical protein
VEKAKYEAYNSQRIGCYQDTLDNIAHSFEFVLEIRFTRINNIILNFFPKFPAILLIYIYLKIIQDQGYSQEIILPPSTCILLEIGMDRFTNQPSCRFPWHVANDN